MKSESQAREPSTHSTATSEKSSGYAAVNGLKLYYEIHGSGEPLILLHGGAGGIEMFGPNLPSLAESYQVIAVDLQGHGHTPDADRPLSFEMMGDDIAALIKYLNLDKANIMGYSLGGGVALQTTLRHPDTVHKLVVVSAPCKQKGFYPEVLENMAQMGPEAAKFMNQSPLAQMYPEANWEVLFTKLGDLLRQNYDWSVDVATINTPVMLAFADADAVQPSHIIEFYNLLGGGLRDAGLDGSMRATARLAILPGTTHYDILSTATLASLVKPFLEAKF